MNKQKLDLERTMSEFRKPFPKKLDQKIEQKIKVKRPHVNKKKSLAVWKKIGVE